MQICLECNNETKNPKFCSSSCSAKFNNKNRGKCLNRDNTKPAICNSCFSSIIVNIRANLKVVKCKLCKSKCNYCSRPAKFRLKSGAYCCKEYSNSCPAVKEKNSSALKLLYLEGKLKSQDVSSPNFTAKRYKAKSFLDLYDKEYPISNDNLSVLGTNIIKKILIIERGHQCEVCKFVEWNSVKIPLQMDHINGNNKLNTRNNLRLLCPNCHSQTTTWCRRKSPGYRLKHDEETMKMVIRSSGNMNQVLVRLDLAWPSYKSIDAFMKKHNLEFKSLGG